MGEEKGGIATRTTLAITMKFFIRTFGCQMNQADSACLSGRLIEAGHQNTEDPEEAQVIIFNTCSVRQHAEERLFQNLNALRPLKKKRPELIIGLIGCIPALRRETLFRSFPHLNFLAGPENLDTVPDLISRSKNGAQIAVFDSKLPPHLTSPTRGKESCGVVSPARGEEGGVNVSAFLPIITGCDNFCSYCVVPFTRGREKSRPTGEILEEAERMVANGVKEIILLGQNVNSYQETANKNKGIGFPELLSRIAGLSGILRLGFMTSHPKDVSPNLFKVIAAHSNIYRHLHLPLQSGSDSILKAMHRGYTAAHYRQRIKEVREIIPGLALTSDIIVGFPGETEDDFKKTLSVIAETKFDDLFAFKYSDRPKTKAEELGGKIPEKTKEDRLARLWKLQDGISLKKNLETKGKTFEVLLLTESRKRPGFLLGKAENEKKILVPGNAKLVGSLIQVQVTSVDRRLLYGVALEQTA
ncbi:MAG: tRNA (N6-isopentenyl adenosine(37)-C2)-methylthiotransferase MiaB [Candidatus Omnitrophota bacterium]